MALTDKSKFSLTLGAFVSLIVTLIGATVVSVNAINSFKEEVKESTNKLQRTCDRINAQAWRIDDQVEYTYDLERFNRELKPGAALRVPDTKEIVRQRLSSQNENTSTLYQK